jgi:hypothetical protein
MNWAQGEGLEFKPQYYKTHTHTHTIGKGKETNKQKHKRRTVINKRS